MPSGKIIKKVEEITEIYKWSWNIPMDKSN